MCMCITKSRLFKYIENFTAKKGWFSDKKKKNFHIFAQSGGSNEYPQSMFLAKKKKKKKKKKKMHIPVNLSFTI